MGIGTYPFFHKGPADHKNRPYGNHMNLPLLGIQSSVNDARAMIFLPIFGLGKKMHNP